MPGVLRIQFVSNLFPDAAQAQRGLDNATLLHELARNHTVRVLSPRPAFRWRPLQPRQEDEPLRPEYVPARYVPKLGGLFNDRLMSAAVCPHLNSASFDVALVSWLFPDGCAVARLARRAAFPFVLIAQGSDVHQYLRSPLRRRSILRAVSAARAVITRSADLKRRLVEAGCEGPKIHPVYNGVDTGMFAPGDQAAARRSLGLPEKAKVILFAGNFFAIKNPRLLIEAHRQLPGEPLLVMAGAGPMEKELRAAAGARVLFPGRQTPSGIARHMRAADLFCLPSWNEGVPNVILEAFASGLPVVASKVGGIHEVLNAPELGSLVPAGNLEAFVSALQHWLAVPRQVAAIRRHGEQFTWPATARRYTEILEAALRS